MIDSAVSNPVRSEIAMSNLLEAARRALGHRCKQLKLVFNC